MRAWLAGWCTLGFDVIWKTQAIIGEYDIDGFASEGWGSYEDLEDARIPNKIASFQNVFKGLQKQEERVRKFDHRPRKKASARVVLGIFTDASTVNNRSRDIRQVIRSTWMRHPDVCTIRNISDACVVRVAFVACRRRKRLNMTDFENLKFLESEPDVLLLDIKENMNSGKSFYWFRLASRHWQWADFVAKADDDAFLHVSNIVDALPVGSPCEAFLGKPWTCKDVSPTWRCPPRTCGPPVDHDFFKYNGTADQKCWVYMQGGFYALSRQMAVNMTEQGLFWDFNKKGPEDLLTGQAVNAWARRTGKCVYVWNRDDIALDRMFYHLRGKNEHPGGVNRSWDEYYQNFK